MAAVPDVEALALPRELVESKNLIVVEDLVIAAALRSCRGTWEASCSEYHAGPRRPLPACMAAAAFN